MKITPFLLALSALPLMASEVNMTPTSISLFENGYGFISLQAKLGDDTRVRLNSLPVPVLGSFWIAAEQGVKIDRLVSGLLDYEVNTEVELFNLAAANEGKRALVSFRRDEKTVLSAEGIILPFPKSRELRTGNTIDQISEPSNNPLLGSILMLKLPDRTLALQQSQIVDISFLDEIKLPTITQRRPGVELELAVPAAGKTIEATCLSSGITWQPSYRITLNENGTGTIYAKATISNNLMNMEKVSLDLVLGSPSLENLYATDPMALRHLHMATKQATMRVRSAIYESEAVPRPVPPSAPVVALQSDSPAAATSTDSVYFYPVASFTAKAGQVITQPLFQSELEYKNVFTWDIVDPRRMQTNDLNDPPAIGEVAREVHFTNPLELPLAEAPIEFIELDRIAATNTLDFTPPKTAAKVYLGTAINITTRKAIKSLKTEKVTVPYNIKDKKVKTITTHTYEVTLTLNNQMEKIADTVITQDVNGHLLNISDQPQIKVTHPYTSTDNPSVHDIRWSLQLAPQSSKTLKYTYEFKTSTIHTEGEKP